MATKDWIKLDKAFKYYFEWIKRNTDKKLILKKTNFATHKNFWEVYLYDRGFSNTRMTTSDSKVIALKYAKNYMKTH